jgi:hypothetical protein
MKTTKGASAPTHPVDVLDQLQQRPTEFATEAVTAQVPPTPAEVLAFLREPREVPAVLARWAWVASWISAVLRALVEENLVHALDGGHVDAFVVTEAGQRALAALEVRSLISPARGLGSRHSSSAPRGVRAPSPDQPDRPGPVQWRDPSGVQHLRHEVVCGCGFVARCDPLPDRIAALEHAGCPRCGTSWTRPTSPGGSPNSGGGGGEDRAAPAGAPTAPPSRVRATSAPDPDFDVFSIDEGEVLAGLPDSARASGDAFTALEDSRSGSTPRVYRTVVRSFASWCAKEKLRALPAHPEVVLLYLRSLALGHRSLSTIEVTHAAIMALHRARGVRQPASWRLRAALRALRRSLARPANGTAVIDLPVLRALVAACTGDLLAKRDRALLLVTYFARLRRSETVSLDRESVHRQPGALFLRVAACEHPLPLRFFPETALDPVRALESWISERALHARAPLAVETGALFVSIRPGRSNTLRLGKRLRGEDLDRILKRRLARARLDACAYSSRSLRAAPDPPPPHAGGTR